jgi:hypothetical protein
MSDKWWTWELRIPFDVMLKTPLEVFEKAQVLAERFINEGGKLEWFEDEYTLTKIYRGNGECPLLEATEAVEGRAFKALTQ